ncbi:hypothetical protein N7535_007814 [Penicillium sp. DV-2018c]|nr:hypothetical protein N7461_003849 [Penicillium sp. DV-2018c]KAJ5566176.1 hypothetical protein N7535_007814 [Penicillium sp. DV-2018c]
MAWWDSSQPNWLKSLIPSYTHELEEVREELATQLEILAHHPGNQQKVSEKLVKAAASMIKIKHWDRIYRYTSLIILSSLADNPISSRFNSRNTASSTRTLLFILSSREDAAT